MRWGEIPNNASVTLDARSMEKMRKGGGPKTFFIGMGCGMILLLTIQGSEDSTPNKPTSTPSVHSSKGSSPTPGSR